MSNLLIPPGPKGVLDSQLSPAGLLQKEMAYTRKELQDLANSKEESWEHICLGMDSKHDNLRRVNKGLIGLNSLTWM